MMMVIRLHICICVVVTLVSCHSRADRQYHPNAWIKISQGRFSRDIVDRLSDRLFLNNEAATESHSRGRCTESSKGSSLNIDLTRYENQVLHKYQRVKSIFKEPLLLKSMYLPLACISTALFNRCLTTKHTSTKKTSKYNHHNRMRPHQVVGRVLTFWSRAGPIIAHYQWTRVCFSLQKTCTREYRDVVYDKLHDRYAPKALGIVLNMKGNSLTRLFFINCLSAHIALEIIFTRLSSGWTSFSYTQGYL
jgi:hypothetical protein